VIQDHNEMLRVSMSLRMSFLYRFLRVSMSLRMSFLYRFLLEACWEYEINLSKSSKPCASG